MEPDYYAQDVSAVESEDEILEVDPVLVRTDIMVEEPNELIDDTEVATMDSRAAFEKELMQRIGKRQQTGSSARAERLARIRRELEELEDDDEVQELTRKVDLLGSKFIEEWKQRLAESAKAVRSVEPAEDEHGVKKLEHSSGNEIDPAKVDSRLNALEEKVGFDGSLQDMINDIYRRVNIALSEESSEEVQARVDLMASNVEKLLKCTRRVDDEQLEKIVPLTDRKINQVYERLQRMPEFESVLPLVIGRLKLINKLVTDTAANVSLVQGMEQTLTRIEQQVDGWLVKLDEMEASAKEDRERFEAAKAEAESG